MSHVHPSRLLAIPLRNRPSAIRPPIHLALLLALLVARPTQAQVNVEPLRKQVTEAGFGARARASLATYAGNTQGVILGSSALVGLGSGRHLAYTTLSGDYARLDSEVSVAKWFAHARHNYQLASWLWWEVYGQIESDRFRRVAIRELLGSGPRLGLLQREEVQVFYGASYLLEHIDLSSQDPSGRGEGTFHRFSNYVSVLFWPHDRILLSSVTYAQPRFDRPSDITLLSVNGAELTITPRLASRIDSVIRYESVVPSDVTRADFELKSSLELVF